MAGRAAGAERAGRGRLGVVLPSFLPSFEIKILGSWRSAGGGPGETLLSAAARRRSSSAVHVGFRRGDPVRRHRPAKVAGADNRGRAAASPTPALGALGGRRAEGVAGSGAAVRSQSGGRLQGRALGGRAFPPGGSECAARRRGDTPSPPEWPAPGERLSWRLHPRSPAHPTPRGSRLRRCARLHGGRPGLRLLPCLSTSNFRATSEQLKGRAETAGQGTPACPRASAAFASSRPPRPRLAAATSAVTSPEPIGIFCVASPPFV